MSFGRLPFSISFDPTSAFPLDARSYFDSYEAAETAAASAGQVGSTDTVYYYGMKVLVNDPQKGIGWYEITENGTLIETGKSAYHYAVDGGFEGTEDEFAARLAELLALVAPDDGDGPDEPDDGDGPSVDVEGGHASGNLTNAIASSLRYTPQDLTDEQKAQARSNIGTMSESEIGELFKKFVTIGTEEPTDGPGFWFDTVNPVEEFPVILQVGDVGSDENDVVVVNVIE